MEEMLLLAKEDSEVAKLLLKNCKYTNSLYHYHQCVEKTIKYVGWSMECITELDLKEISHNPIIVFKKLVNLFSTKYKGLISPPDKHLFTNAKQIVDSKSDEFLINNAGLMLKESFGEKYLIEENKNQTPLQALESFIKNNDYKTMKDLNGNLIVANIALLNDELILNTIRTINYGTKILQVLLVNALICSKYKPDDFRYSSSKIGNPLSYFNSENYIVKNLHYFIDSMDIPLKYSEHILWGL